ncbi:MAG: Wzz/FepE/Etk N-terminal domain-containing protein, partial [Candidatus Omnitrophota bacterium]
MAEYGLNLWDYWRIIHKRKWIIILVFIVSVISTYFFKEKSVPIYRSSVTLYVNTQRTPIAEITGSGVTFWGGGGTNLSTQLELIKSFSVLKTVAMELGYVQEGDSDDSEKMQAAVSSLKGNIEVNEVTDTELVNISVTDVEPEKAKNIAQTIAEVFIQRQWESKVAQARSTKEFVEKQLTKLDNEITDIKRKLKVLGVGTASSLAPMPQLTDFRTRLVQLKFELSNLQERYTGNYPKIVEIRSEIKQIEKQLGESATEAEGDLKFEAIDTDRLQSELVINEKLYGLLRERYEKALILESSKTKDIEIVNPANIPRFPTKIPAATNMFFGAIIGLVLGLVAALITESMDTSIGTIEDVEEYLRLPVLGVIPHIEITKDAGVDYWKEPPASAEERKKFTEIMGRLVTQYRPKSPVAEAYRNLQTYIKFSGLDKFGNCLLFTSAGVREGKTITSV